MIFRAFLPPMLLLAMTLVPAFSQGQEEDVLIGELSYLDRHYMTQQRQSVMELTATHLGRRLNGNTDNDIELMQALSQ